MTNDNSAHGFTKGSEQKHKRWTFAKWGNSDVIMDNGVISGISNEEVANFLNEREELKVENKRLNKLLNELFYVPCEYCGGSGMKVGYENSLSDCNHCKGTGHKEGIIEKQKDTLADLQAIAERQAKDLELYKESLKDITERRDHWKELSERRAREIALLQTLLESEKVLHSNWKDCYNMQSKELSEKTAEVERLKIERNGFLNHLRNRIDRYSGFSGRNEELTFLQSLLSKFTDKQQ